MSVVLPYGIVKTVSFFSVSQYLCPIGLVSFSEQPSAVIFHFKDDNTDACCHYSIDLGIFSRVFFKIEVVEESGGGNVMF